MTTPGNKLANQRPTTPRGRTPRARLTAAAIAAGTAAVTALAGLVAAPPASAIELTPSSLGQGADPGVATLSWRTEVLRTAGGPVQLSLPGRANDILAAAAGRHVVTSVGDTSSSLIVVEPGGDETLLGRRPSSYELSDDGQRIAFTLGYGSRRTLKVVDVVTGRTLGTRQLTGYGAVGHLGARRVFVNTENDVRTWRPGADAMPLLLGDANVVDGSQSAGLLSLIGTRGYPGCARVVALDHPGTVLWRSCTKLVFSFSPDGSRGLALHPATDGYGATRMLVVDTADGDTSRTFTGGVFLREAWESDDDVLLTMHDIDADESALVRCSVPGRSCERAGPVYDADEDRPYANVPWIPAR